MPSSGTPVAREPAYFRLRDAGVARPVSHAHGARLNAGVVHQLAYALSPIVAQHYDYDSTTAAKSTVFFRRSPYCELLYVELEPRGTSTAGDFIEVTLDVNGTNTTATNGAGPYYRIDPGGPSANRLNGSDNLLCPLATQRSPKKFTAFVDVSSLATSSIHRLGITWANGGSGSLGLGRVTVREVPFADVNAVQDAAGEPGVSAAWPNPPNLLTASTASDYRGFVRLWSELEKARAEVRWHRQICAYESTVSGRSLKRASTTIGAFTWPGIGTVTPEFWVRARRLYETSTPENTQVICRYLCDAAAGAGGGTLRVTVNGSTTDVALARSATWATSTATAVTIPCSTTGQEVAVTFEGSTTDAAFPLYIGAVALVGNES
jgi:hypothetical protein